MKSVITYNYITTNKWQPKGKSPCWKCGIPSYKLFLESFMPYLQAHGRIRMVENRWWFLPHLDTFLTMLYLWSTLITKIWKLNTCCLNAYKVSKSYGLWGDPLPVIWFPQEDHNTPIHSAIKTEKSTIQGEKISKTLILAFVAVQCVFCICTIFFHFLSTAAGRRRVM